MLKEDGRTTGADRRRVQLAELEAERLRRLHREYALAQAQLVLAQLTLAYRQEGLRQAKAALEAFVSELRERYRMPREVLLDVEAGCFRLDGNMGGKGEDQSKDPRKEGDRA